MPVPDSLISDFSTNRLNGESVPDDVRSFLEHHEEFQSRTAITLHWEENWSPWFDTSYRNAEDMLNPDIGANVRAIKEVCQWIAFIALDEEGQYYGYWRGVHRRRIANSPIVFLTNEGEFKLYGPTFAQAVLTTTAILTEEEGLREWMISLGITFSISFPIVNVAMSPNTLHKQLYNRYRIELGTSDYE